MKLVCISDTHFRKNRARLRTDQDYLKTQCDKWRFVEDFAYKNDAVIVHGGDVTDTWDQSDWVKQEIFKAIKQDNSRICVYGQHDLRNHRYQDNTSLGVLIASGHFRLASSNPIKFFDKVDFYGCSWEEEIPIIQNPEAFNVLLIHKMIVGENKVWEGQEGYVHAVNFLTDTMYDLIVSGDNHATFVYQKGKQTIINSGSMMRARIDQVNHQPCFFLFDTLTLQFEKILIPCLPSLEVLDLSRAETVEEQNERLQKFTEALADDEEQSGLDFEANMRETIQTNDTIDKEVVDLTWEIIEMAKEE